MRKSPAHTLLTAAATLLAARYLYRLAKRSSYNFRGRVVLITGGSRGLGLVLARQLAVQGAHLALLARNADELNEAASELRGEYGTRVITIVGDVKEERTAELAINAVIREYGALDLLINNAGIITVGPMENMDLADYEEAMQTHFWAPLRFMLAAVPHLRKTRGRIVNISSIGGKVAIPHLAAYSASKHALAGLSDSFRAELAKDGIKITTVFPGLFRSGSHLHAVFKGRKSKEYAWFATGTATPLTSVSVEHVADQILEASRVGQSEIIISWQARLAVFAHTLFPQVTAWNTSIANRFLPGPGTDNRSVPGAQAAGTFPPPSVTTLIDEAAARNNEL